MLPNLAVSQDSTKCWKNPVAAIGYMNGRVSQKLVSDLPKFHRSQYIDMNVLFQTQGNRQWQSHFYYPAVGVGFVSADFGNDSIMGQMQAVYPTWLISFQKNKRLGLDLKLGIGFAHFNNSFDRFKNPYNELIGSSITNFTKLGLNARFRVSQYLALYAGLDFVHCSNGHTKIPNFGLNDPTISFGVRYGKWSRFTYNKSISEDYKIRYNIRVATGVHEYANSRVPVGSPQYPVYNITTYLSKRLTFINDLHFGLGATFYVSHYDYLRVKDLLEGEEWKNSWVMNLMVGHEFLISHFGMVFELNYNFYNPYYKKIFRAEDVKSDGRADAKEYLGSRLGFVYYPFRSIYDVKNNISIGMFLKTNWAQADYVEFNLTYRL